jgi:hypothetical protein
MIFTFWSGCGNCQGNGDPHCTWLDCGCKRHASRVEWRRIRRAVACNLQNGLRESGAMVAPP